MLFNSLQFAIFFPVAALIYFGWNPIVFIVLGGLCGYLWLSRQQKLLEKGKAAAGEKNEGKEDEQ